MTSKVEGFIVLPVWSNNGVIQPLVDDNGYLRVINDGDYSSILSRMHGYDGSNWQKLGLVWNYYDTVSGYTADANASVGTNNLYSTTVPSGELWRIEAVSARDRDNAPTQVTLYAVYDTLSSPIKEELTPTVNDWIVWTGLITLKTGDKLLAQFQGCTLSDYLDLRYSGTKMKVSM